MDKLIDKIVLEMKSSDSAAVLHRISYSLRRVASQRCPVWLHFQHCQFFVNKCIYTVYFSYPSGT